MALAAMDREPDCNERNLFCSTDTARMRKVISASAGSGATPLYRHAQPAPERDQVRREHAEWSQATFGNVGPVGPLKHLSKEALETAAEPGDLSEWADMQFLLWNAQRRAGITDDQITQAMIEKIGCEQATRMARSERRRAKTAFEIIVIFTFKFTHLVVVTFTSK